jgi:pantetheine-phosphate adenylyltransferase
MKKIAIYPGSFDPITNGHVDILHRALNIFDEVIILIANHPTKKPSYSLDTRKKMISAVIASIDPIRIQVDTTEGLTIQYAQKHGAQALVRGLRTVPDFDYEHDFFKANQFIDETIDIVFFMARTSHEFVSSSMIKKLHESKINVENLVPKEILKFL